MARSGSALMESGWLRAPALDAAGLASMRGWFPVALDGQSVSWRHLPARFTEPFFGDTLRAQPREERRISHTPYERLADIGETLAPRLFIFHSSRCGSTLLAQMLAALPQCVVHSEPPVLDDFFNHHGGQPHAQAVPLLRRLVGALGQRRAASETHYIVKLDCWHIRHLPLLRAAFPDTPFWFLYREPAAILASHRRQRGPQMVPDLVLPPDIGAGIEAWDLEGYCAAVLRHIFSEALAHAGQLRLLDYRQLPSVVWEELLAELGLAPTPQQREALQARAGFHAKAGARAFSGDPAAAQDTPPHLPQLLAMLAPLYAQLEARRLAGA
ncbi:hypothetical protein SRABI118_02707 [Massilia sp. Bi118]|uniref:sulfotransferase n=1 Tax=Massilia sp. Bi118 TaxID=2822346 RepID=UPI001DB9094A|nr:sulfotransferase [Massilia sp. Bi118]CAH0240706.1 hypothetical protein SRABI118_02707 [Massilia sp. Bi118]